MMKQEYITKVAEAFRKGEFMSVSGADHVKADYDEVYIDERTDYDFEHVYVHLMKDEREGDYLEILSVELEDEFLESQFAAAKGFTDFYTRAMEAKLWYLRLKFDPERAYEIEGIYELYTRDYAIVAFYVKKM
ncbi:MAG: hypothetical protein J6Q41_00840 [Firmicutes bacterium]|nr:hypothetical protein [Bacillota bacterium]